MIRKTILISLFFAFAFVFKSASAEAALAANVEGWLDNRFGSIPVTVTVTIKDNSGVIVDTFTPPAISAGARYFYSRSNITTSDYPSVSWFTSCDFGEEFTSDSPSVYTFPDQTVRCSSTNSTLTTTKTFCASNSGRVEWKVNTNPAPNNTPNISTTKSFRIYKSLGGDPLADTSPITEAYAAGVVNYAKDIPGLTNGSWNLIVRAYTNDPDNNSTVAYGNFACGVDIVSPGNLNANVGCSGSSARMEFSWTGLNLTYRVQTASSSAGPWTDLNTTDLTQTSYSHTGSPFVASTTYWWRIKAETIPPSGVVHNSSPLSFTTGVCPLAVTPPNLDNLPALTCASTTDNLNTNPDDDNMSNAHQYYVRVQWNRALPLASIQAEQVEFSTNPTFVTGDTTTVSSGFGPLPNLATDTQRVALLYVPGGASSTYYWRINTQIGGNWYQSKTRVFVKPYTSCFAALAQPSAYQYCYNNQPYFNVSWHGSSVQTRTLRGHAWNIFIWGSPVNEVTTNKFMWDGVGSALGASGGTSFSITGPDGTFGPPGINQVTFQDQCYTPTTNPADLLILTNDCYLGVPRIQFSLDYPPNNSHFVLEVSSEPFTGNSSTNPSSKWASASLIDYYGGPRIFGWGGGESGAGYFTGDANPHDANYLNDRNPLDGVTYYWRARGIFYDPYTSQYQSSGPYIYPDGTALGSVNPTGVPFKTKNCGAGYDLSASIVPGSWKNAGYIAGINVDSGGSGYTSAPAVSFSCASGAAGYWKFDENTGATTADDSGNGISGTLVNGPTWVSGKNGSGLNFDGTDDNVNLGTSTIINPIQMSASAWVNPSAPTNNWGVILNRWISGALSYHLSMGDGTTNNKLTIYIDTVTGGPKSLSMPGTLSLGTWHHVAFTYDGSNLNLYVDGALSATTTHTGNIRGTVVDTKVGAQSGNLYHYKGIMDNVRIYDRALSGSEIANLNASECNSGAIATANIDSGTNVVTSITVTNGGSGFSASPAVYLTGGGGTGAVATAQIGGGIQTQSFAAGETASVDVKITNNLGTQTTPSPATLMYFYYKGASQGTSPSVEAPPVCPGDARASPPTLGSVTPQSFVVPAIEPGGSVTQNFKFTVDSAASFATAIAYVVPSCSFGGTSGTDGNFSNNSASFTYSVSVKKFFTSSGDVGAKGKISVGINSSAFATPKYQSRNMLVAEQLSTFANVPTTAPVGFRLNNYKNDLVLKGGVYNYFSQKYKAKAVSNDPGPVKLGCTIATGTYALGNNFYHCDTSVTINSDTTITGTPVFFIDGDLNVNAEVTLANATSGAIFIVNGDIYAKGGSGSGAVNSMNGIFIARKSFYDCTASECGVDWPLSISRLTVVGGVYADGEDGTPGILLQRYLTLLGANATQELEIFTFDPRYYFLYSNILTYAPVGWKEAAP